VDIETAKWLIMCLLGAIGFFLRSLHSKVESSVARDEFNKALDAIRQEHSSDRSELRENQIKLFEKLDIQQQLLTQVATKIAVMAELGKFGGDRNG
jgi:type I site-specific restriction endonuclease